MDSFEREAFYLEYLNSKEAGTDFNTKHRIYTRLKRIKKYRQLSRTYSKPIHELPEDTWYKLPDPR